MSPRCQVQRALLLGGAVLLLAPSMTGALSACVGDSNLDGVVTVDEITIGVNCTLAAFDPAASECAAWSCLFDDCPTCRPTVECIVRGLNNALNGCPPPTPTPPLSDLRVLEVSSPYFVCSTRPPPAGVVRLCVYNRGERPAGPFWVSFGPEERVRIDGLDAEETECIETTVAASGRLYVDSDNEVAETSETNNERSFLVRPQGACTRTPLPTPIQTRTPTGTPLPATCCEPPSGFVSPCQPIPPDDPRGVDCEEMGGIIFREPYTCGGGGHCEIATPTPTETPTPTLSVPELSITTIEVRRVLGCIRSLTEVPLLRVCVANIGGVPTGPFSVAIDDVDVWRVDDGLGPLRDTCLFGGFVPSGEVSVDSHDEVDELDENDNRQDFALPFPTPPVLCTPTVTATPTPIERYATCCETETSCRGNFFPRDPGGRNCLLHGGQPFFGDVRCAIGTERCLPITPTPTPRAGVFPDLSFESIESVPFPSGCVGTLLRVPQIRICVRNQGDGVASNVVVELNGTVFVIPGSFAPNDVRCVEVGYFSRGEAVIDPFDAIEEGNEGNNAITFDLPIPTAPSFCTSTPTGPPLPTPSATNTP